MDVGAHVAEIDELSLGLRPGRRRAVRVRCILCGHGVLSTVSSQSSVAGARGFYLQCAQRTNAEPHPRPLPAPGRGRGWVTRLVSYSTGRTRAMAVSCTLITSEPNWITSARGMTGIV